MNNLPGIFIGLISSIPWTVPVFLFFNKQAPGHFHAFLLCLFIWIRLCTEDTEDTDCK